MFSLISVNIFLQQNGNPCISWFSMLTCSVFFSPVWAFPQLNSSSNHVKKAINFRKTCCRWWRISSKIIHLPSFDISSTCVFGTFNYYMSFLIHNIYMEKSLWHTLTENFSSVFYSAQLTFYTKGFFVVILSGSNPCYWLSISRFRCIFSDILILMILSSYLMQNFIVRA